MSVFLRDYATATASAATSISATIPAGTLGGDFLVAAFSNSGTSPSSAPAGWTPVVVQSLNGTQSGVVFVRRAAGTRGAASSDAGATVTVSWSATARNAVLQVAVLGGATAVRRISHLRVSSTLDGTLAAAYATGRALNLYFGAVTTTGETMTPSSGTVIHRETAGPISSVLATEVTPVAGPDVTFTWTPSATVNGFFTTLVAVAEKPAARFHDAASPFATSGTLTTVTGPGSSRALELQAPTGGYLSAVWVYVASSGMFGDSVTVAVYATTVATIPARTVTATLQSQVGWQQVPISPYQVPAGSSFNVVVFYAGDPIPQMSSAPGLGTIFPLQADALALVNTRTTTSGQPDVSNPTTVSGTPWLIDVDYTPLFTVEGNGGGGGSALPQYPPDMVVSAGGGATVQPFIGVDVSGGGEIALIAWQTEFPAPEPDPLPAFLTDPDLYDEPPVLQTTFDMPDPDVVADGVPVDWEPTEE